MTLLSSTKFLFKNYPMKFQKHIAEHIVELEDAQWLEALTEDLGSISSTHVGDL